MTTAAAQLLSTGPPMIDRLNAALSGRYRVERELGAGGMATVYLADDLKHERKVAIKVLRPELAAVVGAERFLAEIKTTAKLQHPSILPLFDSGEADGFLFYVMPYVEGESLREKLDREKQLRVEDALSLADKVADALDYAHGKGVVHRDIKPANILLSERGEPLVADFGIALAVSQAGGGRITETGLSLGTPHYMSPEQATGDRDVDPRSDVYALACVLYEMLAGQAPFHAPTAQAVLARILTEPPRAITELRRTVPTHVASVLAQALEKLPADRFETAAAFRSALSDESFRYTPERPAAPGPVQLAPAPATSPSGVSRRAFAGISALAVAAVLAAGWGWLGRGPAMPETTFRLDLDLSEFEPTGIGGLFNVAVSPDGSMLAFSGSLDGEDAIYLRANDEPDFRKVPGTEGGSAPTFSPDGEWIAFVHREDDVLRKITVAGGGATTLVNESGVSPYNPHWGTEDRIVFTGPNGVYLASSTSGSSEDLVQVTSSTPPDDPFLLPDGSGVLAGSGIGADAVVLHDLERDTVLTVVPQGRSPSYLESGHILYVAADGGLFAVPFELESREVTGTPVRVLDRVATAFGTGYAISRSGTLVHAEGQSQSFSGRASSRFLMVDLQGNASVVPLRPQPRGSPRFSQDGRFLTYESGSGDAVNIYTFDLLTEDEEQLTTEGTNSDPIWSPDGDWILFSSSREGAQGNLHIVPTDNSRPPQRVDSVAAYQRPFAWREDGRVLFYTFQSGNGDVHVGTLGQEGDTWSLTDVEPYLEANWFEGFPAFSPDGTLVAHLSDRTEDREIWLHTFPDPTGRYRVTTREGGQTGEPRWSPSGDTVYFIGGSDTADTVFVAHIERDPVRPSDPEPLFSFETLFPFDWDIDPDGTRFVMQVPEGSEDAGPADEDRAQDSRTRYFVVINWLAELERKLGGG